MCLRDDRNFRKPYTDFNPKVIENGSCMCSMLTAEMRIKTSICDIFNGHLKRILNIMHFGQKSTFNFHTGIYTVANNKLFSTEARALILSVFFFRNSLFYMDKWSKIINT